MISRFFSWVWVLLFGAPKTICLPKAIPTAAQRDAEMISLIAESCEDTNLITNKQEVTPGPGFNIHPLRVFERASPALNLSQAKCSAFVADDGRLQAVHRYSNGDMVKYRTRRMLEPTK